MFTGIIQSVGTVCDIKPIDQGLCLGIQSGFSLQKVKLGESIAVNGCCLTVVSKKGNIFFADLSHETLRVTSLKKIAKGTKVNLERPLRLMDRLGGHLVQGHVDAVGNIKNIKRVGDNWEVTIRFPQALKGLLIVKGSVAVDGISMTVNYLTSKTFTLVVIPHTWGATNLHTKKVGDPINLEVDIIGKYIEKLLPKSKKTL
ncbi:MAG: riboflavin synthase [Deltaproteobacteria bacterium]|nr:MAG: riboflavin synthase [Deltaproteobacteria bacterium]